MGGGLFQLVATGAQDIYLTGNPQITYFKAITKRHTNFSVESIENGFNSSATFGGKSTALINRSGDMLSKMYIRLVVSGGSASGDQKWAWIRNLGHFIIKSLRLSIGGQEIDYHVSDWTHLWHTLSHSQFHERGYDEMIGNTAELTTLAASHKQAVLYIPLNFFFCRHIGQSLPLIALQYHEVQLDVEFEQLEKLIVTSGFSTAAPGSELGLQMKDATMFCDYVFLDTDERRRFAQTSHEMLIEQTQFTGALSAPTSLNRIDLDFNHPTKEMLWVLHNGRFVNDAGAYKYLWYHPTDVDTMRLVASKRFVLALAKYDGNGALMLNDSLVIPADDLPDDLLEMFERVQAGAITTVPGGVVAPPYIDNVAILGESLTLEEISLPVTDVFASLATTPGAPARATVGHGASTLDVVVRMPDNYGMYLDGSVNPMLRAVLQLNGHDRFQERDAAYFNYIQPLQHHKNTPPDGVNAYSFAVYPESLQPSGSLNFSRIDSATLAVTLGSSSMSTSDFQKYVLRDSYFTLFAFSYNVLRVMSGMCGLAFSN